MFVPFAYVDPSAGGMLFQLLGLIVATVSGALFFFSRQIRSGVARVRRYLNDRLPRS